MLFRRTAGSFLLAAPLLIVARLSFAAGPSFSAGVQTGIDRVVSLKEASGIVASRMNPNVLWSHNDSGNAAQIFSMTPAGASLGTYTISGARNIDWEDIAMGPGPIAGQQYLYIGDIGDNSAKRKNISIYRLPEPMVSDTQAPVSTSVSGAVKLTFAYPGGPRNAESMFVDPLTNDIYIITKSTTSQQLYRAAYPQSTNGTNTLELMATFKGPNLPTAADISPDGNEIIVRSKDAASGRMYVRKAGGTITSAFKSAPIIIPLHLETQGEAIAFDPTGRGYYTTSEGGNQPIYYFDRLAPRVGTTYWDNDGVAAGSRVATGAGIGGSGTWNATAMNWYNGSAELPWASGDNAVFAGTSGTVTLAGGQAVNSLKFKSNSYVLTGSTLTLAGSSVSVDPDVRATIASVIAGGTGLLKSGTGTLNLTKSNSYSGGTTVAAGTLLVNNTTGSGTGMGPVTVSAGGILGGSGAISGAVSVYSGGHISPGASVESLDVGSLTLGAGSILDFELDTVAGMTMSDLINVTKTKGLTISGGTLNLTNVGDMRTGTYTLIDYVGTLGGSVSNLTLGALPQGFKYDLVNNTFSTSIDLVVMTADFSGDDSTEAADYVLRRKDEGTNASFDATPVTGARLDLVVVIVPEPTAWLLLAYVPFMMAWKRCTRHR
jgi:autotransporter-associated beta strand protein